MGFTLSRVWLTQLMQQIARLLEPIYEAQFESIRASRVKAMDETPIKAGLKGPGKMKQGYFWPVYGELDEICFPYCESRRAEHVDQLLGLTAPPGSVLITDGYAAYSRYAQKTEGLTHAQCRVDGDVTDPIPHRSGRAGFPHPVPRARDSLTRRCTGERFWPVAVGNASAFLSVATR
jgi:hypothetical protein